MSATRIVGWTRQGRPVFAIAGASGEPAPEPEPDPEPEPEPDKDPAEEAKKWKALARKHEQQAKANADKAKRLDELEESQKSEVEKVTAKATEAEKRAAQAEQNALRLEVALDAAPEGLSVAKVRKLAKRLQGESREDLEADAEELFSEFATEEPDDPEEPDTGPGRPKEKLKPGASNDEEPEDDPRKIAEAVMSSEI